MSTFATSPQPAVERRGGTILGPRTVANERQTSAPPYNHLEIADPGDNSRSARALRGWLVQSLLLEAIVCDEAGDSTAVEQALEQALEVAEPDRVLLPFTVDPVPALLGHYPFSRTTHRDLVAEILDLVGVLSAAPSPAPEPMREPLTESEARVLRYLPTNLAKREIADELCVSFHTIKAHMKHIYAKLDAHDRREAVERARDYGLLGHSFRHHPLRAERGALSLGSQSEHI